MKYKIGDAVHFFTVNKNHTSEEDTFPANAKNGYIVDMNAEQTTYIVSVQNEDSYYEIPFDDGLYEGHIYKSDDPTCDAQVIVPDNPLCEIRDDKFVVTFPKEMFDKLGVKNDLSNLKEAISEVNYDNLNIECDWKITNNATEDLIAQSLTNMILDTLNKCGDKLNKESVIEKIINRLKL